MMGDLSKFIERMRYWCEEGNLGYDQSNRWDIRVGGECDCSSLVIHALKEAGFDTGAATYTGNMGAELCARGWKRVAADGNPQPGDILLNDASHVAVWLGDRLAQASIDERGRISGGQPGDQGNETNTRGYYNYPWDCYLRWQKATAPAKKPVQKAGKARNSVGLKYRAHVQDAGWLATVHDGQVAGTTGYGKRLEALRMKAPKGWKLEVRAHIADIGWKKHTVGSLKFKTVGTTGKGKAIEALQIRVLKKPEGAGALKFRVHQAQHGWKAWTAGGNSSGSDGLGLQLEAFQAYIGQ